MGIFAFHAETADSVCISHDESLSPEFFFSRFSGVFRMSMILCCIALVLLALKRWIAPERPVSEHFEQVSDDETKDETKTIECTSKGPNASVRMVSECEMQTVKSSKI